MNKKIEELIKVEEDIANYYYQLYICEVNNTDSEIFNSIIKLFSLDIKKESYIFNSLSPQELIDLTTIIANSKIKTNALINEGKYIKDRIKVIRDKYLIDRDMPSNIACSKNELYAKIFTFQDYLKILISFYDEFISGAKEDTRKLLCHKKYFSIYAFGILCESNMIENSFHIPFSTYLTANFESTLKQVPQVFIEGMRHSLVHSMVEKFTDYFKTLFTYNPKSLNSDTLPIIFDCRSALLFLNEEEAKEEMARLGINENNPWYSILMKDRERHKTLSLKYTKSR